MNAFCPCMGIRLLLQKYSVAMAIIGIVPTLHAAPITFTFEAEIDHVFSGIPFESGIDFEAGDVISGHLTFDPSEADGSNPFTEVQEYNFLLNINGTFLTTSNYQIRAWADNVIFDYPPTSVIDDIFVSGSGFSSNNSVLVPAIDPSQSFFRMSLYGYSDAFLSAHIPGNAEIWNVLGLGRQITVRLRNVNGGSVTLQATVSNFLEVPEQSSTRLTLFGMMICLVIRWKKPSHQY